MANANANTKAKAQSIRLLIVDVDGVLTDGRIVIGTNGLQVKSFDVRDGLGLVLARQAGLKIAIITAEKSHSVIHRAKQLSIDWVAQAARDKRKAFADCCRHFKMSPQKICYIGDDLIDLPVLKRVRLSASPSDAVAEVKSRVHVVTKAAGGRGAVREMVELILRSQGCWKGIVENYLK